MKFIVSIISILFIVSFIVINPFSATELWQSNIDNIDSDYTFSDAMEDDSKHFTYNSSGYFHQCTDYIINSVQALGEIFTSEQLRGFTDTIFGNTLRNLQDLGNGDTNIFAWLTDSIRSVINYFQGGQ